MRAKIIAVISLLAIAHVSGGCITDVCSINSGQVELKVSFTGLDLSEAVTLEVDSTIEGPPPADGLPKYYEHRVGTMLFPSSARGGTETFVLDPGAYINRFSASDQRFDWTVVMRVYDAAGRLMAEGRYVLQSAKINGCYLARKMTVSSAQTCDHKKEGDPCVSDSDNPSVCMGSVDNLTCEESTCGDGFTDRRHGELCDPAAPVDGVECHATSCLPQPMEVVFSDGNIQWQELDITGPSPRTDAAAITINDNGSELVVLFGGNHENTYLGDTWTFDGVTWTQDMRPAPVPRAGHAMARTQNDDTLLMYGGRASKDLSDSLNDTWTYTVAGGWSQQSPISSPPAVFNHAMAYDSQRGAVVLLGGRSNTTPIAELWVYQSNIWTKDATDTLIRHGHTLTDVPDWGGLVILGGQHNDNDANGVDDNMLMFSGALSYAATAFEDYAKRTGHQAIFSQALGEFVIFGGASSADPEFFTTSLLRSTHFCTNSGTEFDCPEQQSPDTPHGRKGHVMFELDNVIYVYGGVASVINGESYDATSLQGDTWRLTLPIGPKSAIVLPQGLQGTTANQSLTTALHDLTTAGTSTASVDRAGPMIVADLDGDGAEELILGLPGAECITEGEDGLCGRVLVKDHEVGDERMGETNTDFVTLMGDETADELGTWLGSAIAAGDINGDGAKDLVMGAPRARSGEGALYIVFGGDDQQISISQQTNYVVQIGTAADRGKYKAFNPPDIGEGTMPYHLGYSVTVGDFDGDGLADVVTSAPTDRADSTTNSSVYVLAGAPAATWPSGDQPERITERATLTITSDAPELQLGYSLTTGDLDGDGYTDLIIGTSPRQEFTVPSEAPRFGAVVVVFGGTHFFDRLDATLNAEQLDPADGVLIAAPDADDRLFSIGGVVAAADVDGDGADELVASLGRPSRAGGDPTAIVLFAGKRFVSYRSSSISELDLRANSTVIQGPPNSGFGAYLTAGDANGDLNTDLIIGAPYQDGPAAAGISPRPEAGAVYVVLGSPRADYFVNSYTTVDDLLATDVAGGDDVTIPLVVVRGNESFGFFGSSVLTSSHIASLDPTQPEGYTLVYQPGWFSGDDPTKRNRGRVWTLYLAALFGCESAAPCPLP